MCDCFSPPPVSASASCVSCQTGRGRTCWSDSPTLPCLLSWTHTFFFFSCWQPQCHCVVPLFLYVWHPPRFVFRLRFGPNIPQTHFYPNPKKPPHPSVSPPLSFKDFQMLPHSICGMHTFMALPRLIPSWYRLLTYIRCLDWKLKLRGSSAL